MADGPSSQGGAITVAFIIGLFGAAISGLSDPHVRALLDDGFQMKDLVPVLLAAAIPAAAYLRGKTEARPE